MPLEDAPRGTTLTGNMPLRPRRHHALISLGALLAMGILAVLGADRTETKSEPTHAPPPARPTPAGTPAPVTVLADRAYDERLENLLAGARERIDVVMFSVVLPEDASPRHPVRQLLEHLAERHRAGVAVRVVLDHGVPVTRRRPGEEPPTDNAATWLARAGIPVRWDEDDRTTHVKAVVIDRRWCLVGSHNWTSSALTRNREWSLLVDDPTLAADLLGRMDALWGISKPVQP